MNGSAAFLAFFLSTPLTPVVPAHYAPAPFASATLSIDPASHAIRLLGEQNVAVTIAPSQYQDMDISRAVYVICRLAPNSGVRRIGVWADGPHHLIPADVVDYHTFDPTYVVLDIDTSFLENRTDALLTRSHRIRIEFFARP